MKPNPPSEGPEDLSGFVGGSDPLFTGCPGLTWMVLDMRNGKAVYAHT